MSNHPNKYPPSGIKVYEALEMSYNRIRELHPNAAIIRFTGARWYVFNQQLDSIGHYSSRRF